MLNYKFTSELLTLMINSNFLIRLRKTRDSKPDFYKNVALSKFVGKSADLTSDGEKNRCKQTCEGYLQIFCTVFFSLKFIVLLLFPFNVVEPKYLFCY